MDSSTSTLVTTRLTGLGKKRIVINIRKPKGAIGQTCKHCKKLANPHDWRHGGVRIAFVHTYYGKVWHSTQIFHAQCAQEMGLLA